MYQYQCIKCCEPVSPEMEAPVLEEGAIVLCASCVLNAFVPPVVEFIDLTDHRQNNVLFANELAAQFVEVS